MAYTPIPKGTSDWDVPVNAAFTSQDSRITAVEEDDVVQDARLTTNEANIATLQGATVPNAAEYGFVGYNYDPWNAATALAPAVNQTLYMMRVDVRKAGNATNIYMMQNAGGSGFVAGNNYMGLYDSSGNLLVSSTGADAIAAMTATGSAVCPIASTPLAIGTYYVGVLVDATVRPTWLRTVNVTGAASIINALQPASAGLWTTAAGTFTGSLPATVTMASRSLIGMAWWAGIA